jgi:hypothetical protein
MAGAAEKVKNGIESGRRERRDAKSSRYASRLRGPEQTRRAIKWAAQLQKQLHYSNKYKLIGSICKKQCISAYIHCDSKNYTVEYFFWLRQ